MQSRQLLALATCVILLTVTAGVSLAGEPKPPEVDLKEALKGFKGFLVGELVKKDDDGVVVLVRAVTLVEGNAAANPGVLLGRETPVRFATVKDDAGQERPDPDLVKAVARVGEMPAIAFGGLGGNAIVMMDAGQPGQGHAAQRVQVTTHRMTMRVNDMNVEFGAADEDEGAEKPKGPLFTGRVLAGDDGMLVMDRVMPGSAPGHTWAAMPILRFGEAAEEPEPAAGVEARVLIKAREKAMTSEAKSLGKILELLETQLKRGEELAPEQARRLREEQQKVHAQLDALKAQIAALRDAAARHKQHGHELPRRVPREAPAEQAPPAKAPNQTDF